jgi:hypothetical protein
MITKKAIALVENIHRTFNSLGIGALVIDWNCYWFFIAWTTESKGGEAEWHLLKSSRACLGA